MIAGSGLVLREYNSKRNDVTFEFGYRPIREPDPPYRCFSYSQVSYGASVDVKWRKKVNKKNQREKDHENRKRKSQINPDEPSSSRQCPDQDAANTHFTNIIVEEDDAL